MTDDRKLTEEQTMTDPKRWVQRRYGEIGRREQGCGEDCCAGPDAARLGYRPEELAAAPPGADLGLGCGNPLALSDLAPGEVVLDLGSGPGLDVFLAAGKVGPTGRVIGVDVTPEMVERARRAAAEAGYQNVEFRLGDIEQLPVADDSVDLVISNCVLNLVPDKRRAFGEIARVLRPGGRLAVSDIVLDGPLPAALAADEGGWTSCISGAVGRAEYLGGLVAAGLTEVTVVSEADAAELLAGDCCGDGVSAADLRGVVTSINVTGRKPGRERP